MFSLIAASVFFLLIHFGVSGTRLRDVLVARMGVGPYQGVFALVSIIGILNRAQPPNSIAGLFLQSFLERIRCVCIEQHLDVCSDLVGYV
jgi:hypothetical protein